MRILCMLPAARGVYPADAEAQRIQAIRSYSNAGTQVDVDYMPGDSGFNPWGQLPGAKVPAEVLARAAELSAQRAMQAEQEGYDAFCPFGTMDLGVHEAQLAVKIPVVGQSEACLLFCGLLDRPFAAVSYVSSLGEQSLRRARDAGVEHLMVASTVIGFPNSEFPARRTELLEQFVRCAKEARAKGAQILGLIGISICPTAYSAKELTDACGMPVLDAVACQMGMAEWWHRTGVNPRLLRYPRAG